MSSDVEIWLSADDLSMLGERLVAGLPKTLSGCGRRAQKEGWKSREVKGSGGPGGMRTEYRPPDDVLVQILAFLDANPDFFKQKRGSAARHREELPVKSIKQPSTQYDLSKPVEKADSDPSMTALAAFAGLATSSADWLPSDLPQIEKIELATKLYHLLAVLVGSDSGKMNYILGQPEFMQRALRLVYELEKARSRSPKGCYF